MMPLPETQPLNICRLCGEQAVLRNSHIIPKFIFKWFKNTSQTGYMRSGNNYNKRVQDGLKARLLCDKCEAILSQWEKAFKEKAFQPLMSTSKVSYGDWFLKFSISLSWRVLLHSKENNLLNHLTEKQRLSVDIVEKAWRDVLRGNQPHPGIYEQHLIYLGEMDINGTPIAEVIQNYISRPIDMALLSTRNECFTYTKFGQFIILGFIEILPKQWVGSKIHVKSGFIGPTHYVLSKKFWECILSRAQEAADIKKTITLKQQAIINQFFKDKSEKK